MASVHVTGAGAPEQVKPPVPRSKAAASLEAQLATLRERSNQAKALGPPSWLTEGPSEIGPLTAEELRSWKEDGFVIKHNVFRTEELQPVIAAIESQVDALADVLLAAGKISDLAKGEDFYHRMARLEEQCKGANVLLHKQGKLPQAFRDLWSDARLLDIAQQLLGHDVDVAGHPVWNLRVKVPGAEAAVVPWHQDAAYLDPDSAHTLQVTAWIPLLHAKKENGCMQVLKGGHASGNTATHTCCSGGTWYVDMDLDDAKDTLGVDAKNESLWVTCELPMGSILLLNNLVPHRSLPNVSDMTRWSLDLRWQDASLPAGFWGIKDALLMRKAGDPGYEVQWGQWAEDDRHGKQSKAAVKSCANEEVREAAAAAEQDLEPVIAGPWMLRWELVNHNQHTAQLQEGGEWHKA